MLIVCQQKANQFGPSLSVRRHEASVGQAMQCSRSCLPVSKHLGVHHADWMEISVCQPEPASQDHSGQAAIRGQMHAPSVASCELFARSLTYALEYALEWTFVRLPKRRPLLLVPATAPARCLVISLHCHTGRMGIRTLGPRPHVTWIECLSQSVVPSHTGASSSWTTNRTCTP